MYTFVKVLYVEFYNFVIPVVNILAWRNISVLKDAPYTAVRKRVMKED